MMQDVAVEKAVTTLFGVLRIALGEEPCTHRNTAFTGPGLGVTCLDCGRHWS